MQIYIQYDLPNVINNTSIGIFMDNNIDPKDSTVF